MRRWALWLLPLLGVVSLILGFAIDKPQVYQVSTGWIGLQLFLAAFVLGLALDPES